MRLSKLSLMGAACGVALALVTASVSVALAETPMRINMGAFKGSLITFPAEVALKKGFFKQHGLEPTLIYFGSCPLMINAMQSGAVDTVACPASLDLKDNAKGFHLLAVTNNIAAQEYTLIARKGLPQPNLKKPYPADIRDLKGRTIGVPVLGSDAENVVRFFLQNAGMNPDTDVTWIAVGGPLTAIAAFKAGRVDYLSAWEPEQTVLVTMDKAANVVLDTRKGQGSPLFKNYISNMTVARRSVLAKDPEKFRRLAAVWAETMAYMKSPSHFGELVNIFSSTSGLGKPTITALLRSNLKYFSAKIKCVSLDNVVKFEIDVGDITKAQAPSCKQFVWSGSYKYLVQ